MLIRLALRNVRHFSRDYLIYFLTLTIAVSLFYCFNASGSMGLLTDVEEAMAALGEVTGRTVREDITNRIFERFCVGK